jgi:arylsulfatase A-like enzyme
LAHLYFQEEIALPPTAGAVFFTRLPDFLKNSEARLRWAIRFWGPQRHQESVKGYYRLISGIDRAVGRILDKLEELNLQETTVLLFTSDNGFYLGEKGLAGKWFAHEESIRVPLIVADPRRKDVAGSRRSHLALNLDIAPTILSLAGLPVPASMQGRSLLPVLDQTTAAWRKDFFYEHLFSHPRIPPSEAVRTERWKYVRYVGMNPPYEELYHLAEDPSERENLASDPAHSARLEDLRNLWQLWRQKAR